MRPHLIAVCATLATGILGCSTMQTDSEFDPQATFQGLETYAWAVKGEDESGRPRRVAPVVLRQLETSVDRELSAKGYRRVTADPDFVVDYVVAAQDRIGETAVVTDERLGWVSVSNQSYLERAGALILEISDPTSEQMIWRGWASDVIKDPDVEVMVKKVDEAVSKILAEFPPDRS